MKPSPKVRFAANSKSNLLITPFFGKFDDGLSVRAKHYFRLVDYPGVEVRRSTLPGIGGQSIRWSAIIKQLAGLDRIREFVSNDST